MVPLQLMMDPVKNADGGFSMVFHLYAGFVEGDSPQIYFDHQKKQVGHSRNVAKLRGSTRMNQSLACLKNTWQVLDSHFPPTNQPGKLGRSDMNVR